jgi:hypothetical protein
MFRKFDINKNNHLEYSEFEKIIYILDDTVD